MDRQLIFQNDDAVQFVRAHRKPGFLSLFTSVILFARGFDGQQGTLRTDRVVLSEKDHRDLEVDDVVKMTDDSLTPYVLSLKGSAKFCTSSYLLTH